MELLEAEALFFKENAITAFIGPCFVVDGDTFRRTLDILLCQVCVLDTKLHFPVEQYDPQPILQTSVLSLSSHSLGLSFTLAACPKNFARVHVIILATFDWTIKSFERLPSPQSFRKVFMICDGVTGLMWRYLYNK